MLPPAPAVVRRPRAAVARLLVGVALAAATSGCAGIGQPAPYDAPGINGLVVPTPGIDPTDFVDVVDNPWLALEPGSRRTFDLTGPGGAAGTLVEEVLDDPVPVAGLTATAVRTTTDVDDETTVETQLYAQDEAGNVWLVGADTEGGTDGATDGWRAGTDGAEAGLAMPADPRLGDGWPAYAVPERADVSLRVVEVSEQMVALEEGRDEAGATTRLVYASGTGLVGIEGLDGGLTAVPVEDPAG